jgi:hypothetical protein
MQIKITWTLTPQHASYILSVLAHRPYSEVAPLFAGLSATTQKQIEEYERSKYAGQKDNGHDASRIP